MSDYKMVPVVATEDMRRAGWEGYSVLDGWKSIGPMYQAMLAAAPPFVVTDEVVERALDTYHETLDGQWEYDEVAAMRAAIEAVLGGGV